MAGLSALGLALLVSSHFSRNAHAQAPAPAQKAMPVSGPSPAAEVAKPKSEINLEFLEPYAFDVRPGRRNPFRPPVNIEEEKATGAALPGTPLERFELEEIKLVGIMWQIKAPKAMFVDPRGEVHVLSKDDRIGRKHGYIAAIREGEVVVVEHNNFEGEGAFSTRILQLDRERKDRR
jgi:type IV pilus assembly protein PilP